eukprot:228558_1
MFGISYGWTLVASMAHFLCENKNYCLIFFILNIIICLRFYVICCNIWIVKCISFIGTLASFALLIDGDEHKIYKHIINNNNEYRIAIISSIVLYLLYGWYYQCNWLIMYAIIVCLKYLWNEINNTCILLIIIVIIIIGIFKTGFIFELSLFGYGENDCLETIEFSVLQHYFQGIVHT